MAITVNNSVLHFDDFLSTALKKSKAVCYLYAAMDTFKEIQEELFVAAMNGLKIHCFIILIEEATNIENSNFIFRLQDAGVHVYKAFVWDLHNTIDFFGFFDMERLVVATDSKHNTFAKSTLTQVIALWEEVLIDSHLSVANSVHFSLELAPNKLVFEPNEEVLLEWNAVGAQEVRISGFSAPFPSKGKTSFVIQEDLLVSVQAIKGINVLEKFCLLRVEQLAVLSFQIFVLDTVIGDYLKLEAIIKGEGLYYAVQEGQEVKVSWDVETVDGSLQEKLWGNLNIKGERILHVHSTTTLTFVFSSLLEERVQKIQLVPFDIAQALNTVEVTYIPNQSTVNSNTNRGGLDWFLSLFKALGRHFIKSQQL